MFHHQKSAIKISEIYKVFYYNFRSTKISSSDTSLLIKSMPELDVESEVFALAKGYFDLKEFDRCAFFTKDCKHPRNVFIHFYSRFSYKMCF